MGKLPSGTGHTKGAAVVVGVVVVVGASVVAIGNLFNLIMFKSDLLDMKST